MTEALIKLDVTLPDLALAPAAKLSEWRKTMLAMSKTLAKKNNEVKAEIESRIDHDEDVPDFYIDVTRKRECIDLAKLCQHCRDAGMEDDVFYGCLNLGMKAIEDAYAALMKDAHDMSKVDAIAEFRVETAKAGIIVKGKAQRSLKQV